MNVSFADIHAAADFIGPGAVEVPLYQNEIFDICRRSSPFGQRIKQVPATGHPSRFFEETALPTPGAAAFLKPRSFVSPTVWHSRPVAEMVASHGYHGRATAIYATPVLLDLIDREMKSEFNVVLNTDQITGGFRVKMLATQAGDLPLIPDWSLSYTGTPGSGSAVLPAYIVTEDLIEYHWLGDPAPRIFQLGLPGSLTQPYVAVEVLAVGGKGEDPAHSLV